LLLAKPFFGLRAWRIALSGVLGKGHAENRSRHKVIHIIKILAAQCRFS